MNTSLLGKVKLLLQESFVTSEERADMSARLSSLSEEELSDLVEDLEERARFAVAFSSITKGGGYYFTPENLADLTKEELYDADILAALKKDTTDAITYYDSRHAKRLAYTLERLCATPFDAQYREQELVYRSLLGQLTYMALPLFAADEECNAVFEKQLADAVRNALVPLEERVRNKMLTVWFTKRDALKERLRNAMIRNNEPLTKKTLTSVHGEQRPPTISNWIRDYVAVVGTGRVDTEKEIQYLTASTNINVLAPEEKETVRRLFKLFQFLHLSTLTPQGVEEEFIVRDPRDGLLKDMARGDFIPITPEEPGGSRTGIIRGTPLPPPMARSITTPSSPMPPPKPTPAVPTKISPPSLPARIVLPPQKDASKFFFDLLSPPQGTKVASVQELTEGLSMLAEQNALEKTLTDPKIRELFTAYLKTKNAPDLLGGFKLAPTMPRFMGLFLQWVLQEKGKMSENDAARVGAQLANTLKKKYGNEKYMRIAYFDAGSGSFKWS